MGSHVLNVSTNVKKEKNILPISPDGTDFFPLIAFSEISNQSW